MSKTPEASRGKSELTGVDQLFGRDLRQGGWFVETDLSGNARARPSSRNADRPGEPKPDPAVIWALRNRKR
jgi:hypothetical protein